MGLKARLKCHNKTILLYKQTVYNLKEINIDVKTNTSIHLNIFFFLQLYNVCDVLCFLIRLRTDVQYGFFSLFFIVVFHNL